MAPAKVIKRKTLYLNFLINKNKLIMAINQKNQNQKPLKGIPQDRIGLQIEIKTPSQSGRRFFLTKYLENWSVPIINKNKKIFFIVFDILYNL